MRYKNFWKNIHLAKENNNKYTGQEKKHGG